jgi:hypothetical protein
MGETPKIVAEGSLKNKVSVLGVFKARQPPF